MVRVNVEEALGPSWRDRALSALQHCRSAAQDGGTVEIDGRMLPHEWLETAQGYLKTDSLDHFDDHFFPGCQDIAWDVAAAVIEFGFSDFVTRQMQPRLPFYSVAYLSYRLGYCSMAASSSPDGTSFRTLADGYAARLRHEIDRLC